ncbi:calcium:proton antiporter [Stappia sp. ES.058]|uniref:calcium:proton antiporter n=1 Tax=Stappia sp. ES.058 TaxID=1881061 RepID=UPI00087DBFA4|nr:ionic transporter y4hA [Stappia sp. ES.058]SDU21719.1 Ca2+:H+ antiporter [Stappia sp. ES.058]
MSHASHGSIPHWSWLVPVIAALALVLVMTDVLPETSVAVLGLVTLLLGGAVFASVHHAEVLAARVGEPYGSIILAVCVTVIEVALIVSIMLSGAEGNEEVARDTVFSAIMIVLNGVIGFCLVLGGQRHHEQSFQLNAASASLAVLGTLATVSFVLPNFVMAGGDGQFSILQLVVIGVVSLGLYGTFVFVQTVRHRDYFLEAVRVKEGEALHEAPQEMPSGKVTLASVFLLPLALLIVILLAKILSHPLDTAVAYAGLPQAVVGVAIAAVVLLPEGIASVRAAVHNQLQNSVNLVLGSALASIGLTIPVVAAVSVFMGKPLVIGLVPEDLVLLVLTLFVSTLTLGTGRTTILQGAVHLSIFAVFLLLSAIP